MEQGVIIAAAKAQPASKIDNEEAIKGIVNVITHLYMVKGLNLDKTMVKFTACEVLRKIVEDLPLLTLEELKIACDKGVYGEFDPDVPQSFTVNAQTIIAWCKSYVFSPERQNAISIYWAAQRKELPPALPPMSDEEVVKSQIRKYWDEARNEGRVFGFARMKARAYDWLVDNMKLGVNDICKREAFEHAKRILGYHEESGEGLKPMKGIADGYMLTFGAESPKEAVVNVAKSICLEKALKTMDKCPV